MEQPKSLRVLVPITAGVDELGAASVTTILRRGGCHVVTASVSGSNPIVGQYRMRLLADIDLHDALVEWANAWDLVVCLGGPSAAPRFAASSPLVEMLSERLAYGRPIAALGAGVGILTRLRKRTDCVDRSPSLDTGGPPKGERFPVGPTQQVIVENRCILARNAGSAIEFALTCLQVLLGDDVRNTVQQQIMAGL